MRRRSHTPDFSLPTRRELVHGYIERLDARDISQAGRIADEIEIVSSPLAEHLVLIPVAAHQEQLQIQPAINAYARQVTDQPFSIVLGLNSPTTEFGNPSITDTLAQIEQAKQKHPHLDIRTSMSYYDEPVIGTIRRDLWNGALLASMDQGAYTQDEAEIIGINHDIDTVSMSPRYIKRVQDHYNRRQRAHDNAGMQPTPHTPTSTLIKHAHKPTHPVISRGVYWEDFFNRQMNIAYEAGMVFPLSYYAGKDGFDPEAKTHEVGSIFPSEVQQHKVPGTNIQTSPRRYIDRLKYGYSNLWTEDSFGPNDQCRLPLIPATDMTQDALEAVIVEKSSIRQTVAQIATRAINATLLRMPESMQVVSSVNEINDYLLQQNMQKILNKKLFLTAAVLERIVQSPRLAEQARMLYGNDDFKAEIIDQFSINND